MPDEPGAGLEAAALVPVLGHGGLPLVGSTRPGSRSRWRAGHGHDHLHHRLGPDLVFGLMDVLNFGHGVFIALGAFVATSVLGAMGDWTGQSPSCGATCWRCCRPWWWPCGGGGAGAGVRALHRAPGVWPAPEADPHHHGRHDHWRGLIKVDLGPQQIPLPLPEGMRGSLLPGRGGGGEIPPDRGGGGAGRVRPAGLVLSRTKIGLLIAPACRTARWWSRWATASGALFVGVFVAGLGAGGPGRRDVGPVPAERDAADGRAGQRADLHRHHHRRPGQHRRRLIGALLVGLMANYTGFLAPKVALFSNIA